MTKNERVTRAIEFQRPDRVPCQGGPDGDICMVGYSWYLDPATREEFPNGDVRHFTEWGFSIRTGPDIVGYEVANYPVYDWADFPKYRSPDPDKIFELFQAKHGETLANNSDMYRWLNIGAGPFLLLHNLRKDDNFLMDLAAEKEKIGRLFDLIVDAHIEFIKRVKNLGIDGVVFFDDWGHQEGMFFSMDTWREIFLPRYARFQEATKNLGMHLGFQATGKIMPVLPDLVELGVDTLIPYQHELLGIDNLREVLGGKICCFCSLDFQRTGVSGTTEECDREVKHLINALATFDGGLIFQYPATHEFKKENKKAGWEAYLKYRNIY